MKLNPRNDKIVVKEEKQEEKVGNVLLPGTANSKNYNIGTVMACSESHYKNGHLVPSQVKVGEKILYMKYASNCYRDESTLTVIIREDDVLAVVED